MAVVSNQTGLSLTGLLSTTFLGNWHRISTSVRFSAADGRRISRPA
jgi:hypothetical protein